MKKQNLSNLSKQRSTNAKNRPYNNSSISDPMNPLQNTYLKEKRINMIINFLSQNNYQNNFSKKDFINMTIDFRPILKFIMEKLDPNMNLLESQTEDKIEALAKIYDYPGKLNKSFIRDFNTPSNFLYILTFICYMANLCSYKDYFINKEINNTFYKTDNNISSQLATNKDDNIELADKKEYYEFLDECINSMNTTGNNQQINEVIEKYKNKFSSLCNEELNKIEKNFAEYEQLEKENRQLESQLPNIDTIKSEENEMLQKLNFIKEEYDKSNEEINLFNQKLIDITNDISQKEKNIEKLDNDIKNTRNIIDTQIMSRAEYDIQQEDNNNILNKIEIIQKEIDTLKNTKNDIINTNQSLINKLTIIANDINNIDFNNTKKIKNLNNINSTIEKDDITYLLNMTAANKEIKDNIFNNNPDKNRDLIIKYDQIIIKYNRYITDIKNEYNTNIINNNELSKNKDILRAEIDKYNNFIMNDNNVNDQQKEMMNKLNNDIIKYNKENGDYMNLVKNDIKIYENNIENKKQKLIDGENEYNKLKEEFDEFKNETYELINALSERYNLYYNNFIDFSNEITNKIVNYNQNLKNICDSLPKKENKKNSEKEG